MFGDGLRGVRLKSDLARNEALMYIPNKCIISTEHARKSQIGHLFDNHDALFVAKDDRDQTTLIVYMIYEKLKGEESFYHPYFEVLDSVTPAPFWPAEVIEKSDVRSLKVSLSESKKVWDDEWDKLNNFFSIYPDYFDPERMSKDLYLWALGILQTRSFGWGLPATMLIPLGDNINHNP